MWGKRALVAVGLSIMLAGCTGTTGEAPEAPAADSNTDERVLELDLCGIVDFQPMLAATSGTIPKEPVTVPHSGTVRCAVNVDTDRWAPVDVLPYLSVEASGFDSAAAAEEDMERFLNGDTMGIVPNWKKDTAIVDGPTDVPGAWDEGVVVTGRYADARVLFQAMVRKGDYRLTVVFNGDSAAAKTARGGTPYPSTVDDVRPALMELLETSYTKVSEALSR